MRNILKLFASNEQRARWVYEQGLTPGAVVRHAAYTVVNELQDTIIYCRIIRDDRDADMLQGMEFHELDTSERGCLKNCSGQAFNLIRTRIRK